jgi:hypothetical protein
MKGEKLNVVRGSRNVFHDLRRENPDVEQFKAILAAEIIKTLDKGVFSMRQARPVPALLPLIFRGFALRIWGASRWTA